MLRHTKAAVSRDWRKVGVLLSLSTQLGPATELRFETAPYTTVFRCVSSYIASYSISHLYRVPWCEARRVCFRPARISVP